MGYMGWFMSIFQDASYQRTHLQGFHNYFQTIVVIARGNILRSMALMLGVNILLALAKDFGGLCLITIGEMFYLFISCSIVLQL
jgi:hypothetical protein